MLAHSMPFDHQRIVVRGPRLAGKPHQNLQVPHQMRAMPGPFSASMRWRLVASTSRTGGSALTSSPASASGPSAAPGAARAAGGYSQADTEAMKGSRERDRMASQSTW